MNNFKFRKSDLLDKIKANRNKHKEIFEEAWTNYRNRLIELLDEMKKKVEKGNKIDTYINLVQPVNQIKDYDRAILMLEMTVDDEITLTESQFSNYVLDQWNWSKSFATANAFYSEKISAEDYE